MRKVGLIIFVALALLMEVSAALPSLSIDSFDTLTKEPFRIHYVGKDESYANDAAKILTKAFDELLFDFQLDSVRHFNVYIMPTRRSFREALGGKLPAWTGAYASPTYNRMVVKSPRWNHESSFKNSLIHELVHLVIHNYLGAHDLPRWMDEGLAIFYSGEQRWKTATALSKAISTNSLIPLSDIDYVLEYHQAKADLAYQQSYSAVLYLLKTYDIEAVRRILSDLRSGVSLQQSFMHATGSPLSQFEIEWQMQARKTHKWMWFYEIDNYVWIFIFVLVVLAFIARKIRNRKIERQWQDEHYFDDDWPVNDDGQDDSIDTENSDPNDDESNLLL